MYYLRMLQENDLTVIKKYINRDKICCFLGAPNYYTCIENVEERFREYVANFNNSIRCVIVNKKENEIVGVVSLTNIDYIMRSAQINLALLNEKYSDVENYALNEIVKFAFGNIGLNQLQMQCLPKNEENIALKFDSDAKIECFRIASNGIINFIFVKKEYMEQSHEDIFPWCINRITNRYEIDNVMRMCDDAFDLSISQRNIYKNLLEKIYTRGIVLVACNEKMMGYCAMYANDLDTREAYISLLAVRPEYQGKHVGTNLLKTSLRLAEIYGMTSCSLEVMKNNERAMNFYELNGFNMYKEQQNSYLVKKFLS